MCYNNVISLSGTIFEPVEWYKIANDCYLRKKATNFEDSKHSHKMFQVLNKSCGIALNTISTFGAFGSKIFTI
jgi:hypothetical protein